MKKKPLGRIRIAEICEGAGIDRTSFYYHFRDKYDLTAWIFFHAAGNINIIDPAEAAENLRQMKKEMLFFRRSLEDPIADPLWKYMLEYFTDNYTRIAMDILHCDILSEGLQFAVRQYCYGGVGMCLEWILRDRDTKVETIISRLFANMPEVLKKIYFTDEGRPRL